LSNILLYGRIILSVDHHPLWLPHVVMVHPAVVATVVLIMVVVVDAVMVGPTTVAPPTMTSGPFIEACYGVSEVCLKIGHTTNNCWHRFEEDYVPDQHTAATASSLGANQCWYTDSGATGHIIGDLDRLMMHDPYIGHDQVHAANRIAMDITHIGTSIIPTTTLPLTLNNVLHVPSAHKNLIYVHRFTIDNDTFIEFHPYFFLIKDRKMKKVLLHG
jgi:hypothetical protein